MIKERKIKHFNFTCEDFLKDKEKIMSLPFEKHEDYDACWIKVEGNKERNSFSFGTHYSAPVEVSFEYLVNHRQEVLDKLFHCQEIDVFDENGKTIFTMHWC
jgi:hypothetical protein